jgi:hypothetical protein
MRELRELTLSRRRRRRRHQKLGAIEGDEEV